MPEGLNPIEVGKQLHEHVEQAEQLERARARPDTTDAGHGASRQAATPTGAAAGGPAASGVSSELGDAASGTERHSRRLQIGEAILLSLVTIAAAWAGYAAAKWGTASRIEIAHAATLRNLASRADLTGLEQQNFDASTFNAWFIAYELGKPRDEAVAVRRFRPIYREAFDAWLATDPFHNPNAPPEPSDMPQYKLPALALANRLDAEATASNTAGNNAGATGDDYVRITVFLAAVLFLVGIGSTFKLPGVRYLLVGFGTALLIVATVLLFTEPGLPK